MNDTIVDMMNNAPKDRCPMCGHEFEEVKDFNHCPRCREITERDCLIGEWDDCAWDY